MRQCEMPANDKENIQIAYVRNELTETDILLQIAEECGELAQASCKLARINLGSNPTPKTKEAACKDLMEEIADVLLCCDALFVGHESEATKMLKDKKAYKLSRWYNRVYSARASKLNPCNHDASLQPTIKTRDGEEIKVGRTYYGEKDARRWTVVAINPKSSHKIHCVSSDGRKVSKKLKPDWLVSEKPLEAFDCAATKIHPGQIVYMREYPLTVIVQRIVHENVVEVTTVPDMEKTETVDSINLSASNTDSESLLEADMQNSCSNWELYCNKYHLEKSSESSCYATAIKHIARRIKKLQVYA